MREVPPRRGCLQVAALYLLADFWVAAAVVVALLGLLGASVCPMVFG